MDDVPYLADVASVIFFQNVDHSLHAAAGDAAIGIGRQLGNLRGTRKMWMRAEAFLAVGFQNVFLAHRSIRSSASSIFSTELATLNRR